MRLNHNDNSVDVYFEDGWVSEVWADCVATGMNTVRVNIGPFLSDKDCDNLIEQAMKKRNDD